MRPSISVSQDNSRAIVLRSAHRRSFKSRKKSPRAVIGGCILIVTSSPVHSTRSQATFDSKSYRDGLQRAFNRAKQQIYFNPDMQFFVTLTYAGIEDDYTQVMHDIKMLVKSEKRHGNELKYIYVFEWQKRGSLHVHMITNSALTTYINDNGYKSLRYWRHGFTSMLTINDFDSNFRPHLYLFKYMRKAERIGKSFIHSSRNLNTFRELSDLETIDIMDWTTVNQEHTTTYVNNRKVAYTRTYLQSYDTIRDKVKKPQSKIINIQDKVFIEWLKKVQLNSSQEHQKRRVNHIQDSSLL